MALRDFVRVTDAVLDFEAVADFERVWDGKNGLTAPNLDLQTLFAIVF